jgi:hypothetical protein
MIKRLVDWWQGRTREKEIEERLGEAAGRANLRGLLKMPSHPGRRAAIFPNVAIVGDPAATAGTDQVRSERTLLDHARLLHGGGWPGKREASPARFGVIG